MRLKYRVHSATTLTVVSEPIANTAANWGIAAFPKLRSGTHERRDLYIELLVSSAASSGLREENHVERFGVVEDI